MAKRRALARGLDALLSAPSPAPSNIDGALRELPVDLMQRGRYQPRLRVDSEALEELANSIRAQGVVQPIVVRPVTPQEGAEQRYEIIAGERRWRASQLAGLDTVPALVREVSDDDALAMALIENIQREDLTPIEEAQALARFVDEFGLTHQAAAEAVGRSRASVSNLIRLLELDPIVRSMMERGELDMGQGRALLALPSALQKQAAAEIVAKGLTARQTEALVRKLRGDAESDENLKKPKAVEPNVARLAQELSERLGSTVQIQHNAKGRGKLTIQFNSLDEFDGILERLND
jgi:ParB family chromosome partitioning protein